MLFGDSGEFAIEAYHEPVGPTSIGFGRMTLHLASVTIGNIHEEHCGLNDAAHRLRTKASLIGSLWNPIFTNHTDEEIFALIDRELYVECGQSNSDITLGEHQYGKFDFLTNAGEQFDDFKSFIYATPHGTVHILYQHRDGTIGSGMCKTEAFQTAVRAFVQWFDFQLNEKFGIA